jgi:hypothetical protein
VNSTFPDQLSQRFSHWPEATPEAEKWRYETIKLCSEAVERSALGSEEKQRRKKCYNDSVTVTVEEISQSIGKICFLDESSKDCIKSIVRGAARLWLELGCQHCRFLIVVSDTARNELDGSDKGREVVDLIVQPKVLRVGNSRGERLEKDEVVRGCKGEQREFVPAKR